MTKAKNNVFWRELQEVIGIDFGIKNFKKFINISLYVMDDNEGGI